MSEKDCRFGMKPNPVFGVIKRRKKAFGHGFLTMVRQ